MAIKNAQEPQCWKWWSFDHQQYWTVDTTDVIPILVRLKQSETDDQMQENGRWITEAVADSECPEGVNAYPISLILRIDKLFGSDFAKAHKDHFDKKPKQNINRKEEYMTTIDKEKRLEIIKYGASQFVDCITNGLEDSGMFDDLTDEEKEKVESVVNECFSFFTDNLEELESLGEQIKEGKLEKQEFEDWKKMRRSGADPKVAETKYLQALANFIHKFHPEFDNENMAGVWEWSNACGAWTSHSGLEPGESKFQTWCATPFWEEQKGISLWDSRTERLITLPFELTYDLVKDKNAYLSAIKPYLEFARAIYQEVVASKSPVANT